MSLSIDFAAYLSPRYLGTHADQSTHSRPHRSLCILIKALRVNENTVHCSVHCAVYEPRGFPSSLDDMDRHVGRETRGTATCILLRIISDSWRSSRRWTCLILAQVHRQPGPRRLHLTPSPYTPLKNLHSALTVTECCGASSNRFTCQSFHIFSCLIVQGLKCKDCGLSFHKRCEADITHICSTRWYPVSWRRGRIPAPHLLLKKGILKRKCLSDRDHV